MDPAITPAIIGFVGVIVGSVMTGLKDWFFHQVRTKRDAEYLAVRVACALERYACKCSEVADDQGEHNEQGEAVPEAQEPSSFSPESYEVEWRSLPTELMYSVLDFPSKEETARALVRYSSQHAAPDNERWFEERQWQYAELGLAALSLAAQLRQYAGLPRQRDVDHDTSTALNAAKARVQERRALRAARNAESPYLKNLDAAFADAKAG